MREKGGVFRWFLGSRSGCAMADSKWIIGDSCDIVERKAKYVCEKHS